ncbi:hypothetical protein ERIC2_c18540 [Paenibacillus larvae subsp. larvae DSM 25430]|uniref:Uncharacterized protein n=1 Tax=Paenibacillus larvae subsp. larvae DSM 25430 TaxID=697284 RepID=V9W964_9BACL|nr:hypothetical protein ERIC2_c18540 [Paenibacillus larvae subsp. larvae DSM 25430]
MSASGVNKGDMRIIGRDILLVMVSHPQKLITLAGRGNWHKPYPN